MRVVPWPGLGWATILLLCSVGTVAQALDPERLGAQDTRFLQAALAWSGDYVGLTDGDWGDRSQTALDAALGRSGGDPYPILMDFVQEVRDGGWTTFNLDGPLTVALPTAFLVAGPEEPDRVEFRAPDGSLVFRIHFSAPWEAGEMHDWMLANHAGSEEPYHSGRGDRIVTAVTLASGQEVYLRSALIDGLAVSMQVLNDPWQDARADLIAATMQWGHAPDLLPEWGGPIDRILLSPEPPTPAEPPAVASMIPPAGPKPSPVASVSSLPPTELIATGTGFFVNNTDVVTAAHVVEGCRELRLDDGAPLVVVAADAALDLAVLAAGRRSSEWLALGAAEGPRLGQPVFALGYPLHGSELTANQGLSVTSGNISALPRIVDASSRVSITAPVQPGNSGGPILGSDGSVQGVVVERADDLVTLEVEGVLPQNMNRATSVAQLLPFLKDAGVLFPSAADGDPVDLSQGIPAEMQSAVVLIGCY